MSEPALQVYISQVRLFKVITEKLIKNYFSNKFSKDKTIEEITEFSYENMYAVVNYVENVSTKTTTDIINLLSDFKTDALSDSTIPQY